ncbi:MAG: Ig-like domain-containing protein [Eubacteriales bacterium]|nr:Ig-like domain-containing protein [Eubacteriales bacterium]
MEKIKKVLWTMFLAALVCILPPLGARADSDVRFVGIGRGEYTTASDLGDGPGNDLTNMKRVLESAYGTLAASNCSETVNTVSGVQEMIQETFADSTEDSLNYFFYSGHGTYSSGTPALVLESGQYMTAALLAQAFSGIQGTNILVIDACYSGGLISGSSRSSTTQDFSEVWTDALASAFSSLPKSRTALTTPSYYVLTGSSENELTWQENFYSPADTTAEVGYFSSMVAYGCGIDASMATSTGGYLLGETPADYDRDGKVTFDELREFLENQCLINHVSMYPAYNNHTFIPAFSAAPKVILKDASVSYSSGEPIVTVTYDALENFSLGYWNYYDSNKNLGRFMGLTSATSSRIASVISSRGIGDLVQAGTLAEQAAGEGTFSFQTENVTSMFLTMFQVSGQTFRYSLPYSVTESEVTLPELTVTLGNTSFSANGTREVRIRASFGSSLRENLPQAYLTVQVLDASGNVVRILSGSGGDLVDVIQDPSTSYYQYYSDYYWNGRNDAGEVVATGAYKVQVTADFGENYEPVVKTAAISVTNVENSEESETETETTQTEDPNKDKLPNPQPIESEKIPAIDTESTEQTETSQTETPQTETQAATEQTETELDLSKLKSLSGSTPKSTTPKKASAKEPTSLRMMVGTTKVSSITIGLKESLQMSVLVLPEKSYDQTVTYKSGNSKILKVTKNGRIIGLKVGKTTLTATAVNGVKTTINVTVRKAPTKITLAATKKTLKKGKTFQIKYKLPAGMASYQITFTSSNKKVATVSATGKVKGLKKGVAVITVRTYNKKKAKITVTVK